jgi:NuA3 HAT complex component NTO1
VTKRRRNQAPKMSWRLPSGAPVVPAVVFNTVETSLARFTIRKRKEFVERACRYWTLKREARRGAALLKRLQLQLESFSSMEITRRNFAAMGSAGRPRLQRRIEFAELLQKDMAHVTGLTADLREREELRLKEVELLRELVDAVYFPIPALLGPILQRVKK